MATDGDLEGRLTFHLSRVPDLLDDIASGDADYPSTKGRRATLAARCKPLDDEQRLSAFIVLLDWWGYGRSDLNSLLRSQSTKVRIDELDDLALVLALATRGEEYIVVSRTLAFAEPPVLDAVDRLGEPARALLDQALGQLMGRTGDGLRWIVPDELRRERHALFAAARGTTAVSDLLPGDDAFTTLVRDAVDAVPPAERRAVMDVLQLVDGVPDGPRPTKRWQDQVRPALEAASAIGPVLATVLDAIPEVPVERSEHRYGGTTYFSDDWLDDHAETFARGLVWAACLLHEPWSGPTIERVALASVRKLAGGPAAPTLANASIAALATLPPDDAVLHLNRVGAKLRHKSLRTQLQRALTKVATDAGISPEELAERSVPSHGLDATGRTERQLGGHTAVLAVDDAANATLQFVDGTGKVLRGVPAAVKQNHAEELRELRAELKDLKTTLSTERRRLEDLLAQHRSWPGGTWRQRYLDHPVTGALARRLIWTATTSDGAVDVLPATTDATPTDGRSSDVSDLVDLAARADSIVALWHPCEHGVEEVRAWRERVLEGQVRQPFKQAFREVYLLTPAEEATRTYSNRFAAHIVTAGSFQGVVTSRGWSMSALGMWDGGHESTAVRELPGTGIAAELHVDLALEGGSDPASGLAVLASTDRVQFIPVDSRAREPLALDHVPRRVFSEAMRDVDLFVSVASIAMDPAWLDRGETRFVPYWRDAAFGSIGQTGELRHEVLAHLLPRLRIADRCTLEDRYLVVRGDLRTYRIHLGTANVKMDPNDQYLCIVAARDATPAKLFLPVDDDRTLSVIISKALLLAADAAITDPLIRRQIDGA